MDAGKSSVRAGIPRQPPVELWSREYSYAPADIDEPVHPNWDIVLGHIAASLDAGVRANEWCQANGIRLGREWLLNWVACMLREPFCQLPFLFAWGEEDSGKSIFHESLALLMTLGVVDASRASRIPTVSTANSRPRFSPTWTNSTFHNSHARDRD